MIKLVSQYNNNYHCSIGKKPVDADYSALTEEIESGHKGSKIKVGERVSIIKCNNIFSKGYTKYCSKEIFAIVLC